MTPPIDRLSALLEQFQVEVRLFHNGPLCGTVHFAAEPGRGFLHFLRRGELTVVNGRAAGPPVRVVLTEPSVLFYPGPLAHEFRHTLADGSDLTCAALHFEGAEHHPLVRALPATVLLPLKQVQGLDQSLALLFSETDQVRCGHRLLADRLFEVVFLQLLRWLLDHPQEGNIPMGLLTGLADPLLARTLTAVHEAPDKAWNLMSMAQEAAMSRSAFTARFKRVVGTTPADYLVNWRLAIAQAQLRQGRSIKHIASHLGYMNPSALSRIFKQKIGASPRDWVVQNNRHMRM